MLANYARCAAADFARHAALFGCCLKSAVLGVGVFVSYVLLPTNFPAEGYGATAALKLAGQKVSFGEDYAHRVVPFCGGMRQCEHCSGLLSNFRFSELSFAKNSVASGSVANRSSRRTPRSTHRTRVRGPRGIFGGGLR